MTDAPVYPDGSEPGGPFLPTGDFFFADTIDYKPETEPVHRVVFDEIAEFMEHSRSADERAAQEIISKLRMMGRNE